MQVVSVELVPVRIPLRTPWHTTFGTLHERDVLLVRVETDRGEGWGECSAFAAPGYSPEFIAGAQGGLRDHLAPLLVAATQVRSGLPDAAGSSEGTADPERPSVPTVADVLAPVNGNRMAKSALEMAVLDAELRATGQSFAARLGVTRDRVDAGVALGLGADTSATCDAVAVAVDAGYRRVKLKIEPGRDLAVVAAVREQFPALSLAVDANGAYERTDARHLAGLDDYGLAYVEQPLAEDDLVGHARLAEQLLTPICLDEPLVSLRSTEAAVALGACRVVNLKPARVGGYLEATRIHDWCLDRGVPMWCGGMLETGLGRAANVALAALGGFTLTGDLSPSARFYETDIVTDPVVMDRGTLAVPTDAGWGIGLDAEAVKRFRMA